MRQQKGSNTQGTSRPITDPAELVKMKKALREYFMIVDNPPPDKLEILSLLNFQKNKYSAIVRIWSKLAPNKDHIVRMVYQLNQRGKVVIRSVQYEPVPPSFQY